MGSPLVSAARSICVLISLPTWTMCGSWPRAFSRASTSRVYWYTCVASLSGSSMSAAQALGMVCFCGSAQSSE
jgi:hypothetical protein